MIRLLLLLLAVSLALLWRLPAGLLDQELARISHNEVRLALAQGSVWAGSGDLVVFDAVERRWQPWLAVAWHVDAGSLWRGVLGIRLAIDGRPEASVDLSWREMRISGLALTSPAGLILARIPDALGRAGWKGDMSLVVADWHCDWSWHCGGHSELTWMGAASDLFPGRQFGDYRLQADGRQSDVRLGWTTLRGDIRIEGSGRWQPQSLAEFSATVSGDPAFLEHLPSVGGRWVRPGETPGTWLVDFRP